MAKSDLAHWRVAEQFAQRKTKKFYLAIVHGEVRPPVAPSLSRLLSALALGALALGPSPLTDVDAACPISTG